MTRALGARALTGMSPISIRIQILFTKFNVALVQFLCMEWLAKVPWTQHQSISNKQANSWLDFGKKCALIEVQVNVVFTFYSYYISDACLQAHV